MTHPRQVAPYRLITAMLPKARGVTHAVRDALIDAGINEWASCSARGALPGTPLDRRGVPRWDEMDVLEVLVPADRADAVFAAVYQRAGIGESGGGMLLMRAIRMAHQVQLPGTSESQPTATASTAG